MSTDTPFKDGTREPLINNDNPLIFALGDGIVGIVQKMYLIDGDDLYIEYYSDLATSSEVKLSDTTRKEYLDILNKKVENWLSEEIYAKIATLEEANGGESNQD